MAYTSCFVGIPLPEKYQPDFETIIEKCAQIDPSLRMANPHTPHITLYYLSVQSQNHVSEIAQELELTKSMVASAHVTVGGLGVFGGDIPSVLFLNADCSPEVAHANQQYTDLFDSYYARDNKLSFHPHMTIAKLPDEAAQTVFKQNRSKIEELCAVNWHFPVTEIVMFGVDSTQDPEIHQKLYVAKL